MLNTCVLVGLDWAKPMMFCFFAHHMLMHYSCIRTFSFLLLVLFMIGTFLFASLSLPLSPSLSNSLRMAPKRKSAPSRNPLYSRASSYDPTPFSVRFRMRRPVRTSRRTSPNVAFIWNAAWFYRIFPILLYPLSFTVRNGNLYVRYPWTVPPWLYRSSIPICTVSIPLYLDLLHRFEVYVS